MNLLGPLLPERYSPLQATGRGNQGVYLTIVNERLALALVGLIGQEARDLLQAGVREEKELQIEKATPDILRWEDHVAEAIKANESLPETEREALIMARRGQGIFKRNVSLIERHCRVTGVSRPEHLIASHTKPWRQCETHEERLDGENGLLLTPSIDHLFDRGFISFEDDGRLILSGVAHNDSLERMGVPTSGARNVGAFSEGQKFYLEFHRENVLLRARVR
jgi:hypothetical protein